MVSVIKGLGLLSIGIFSIIWLILKIISCIFIAGYISTYIGFTTTYWCFTSIIIFSILCRLCVRDDFSELYVKSVNDIIHGSERNPIFDVLKDNYGEYDTRIIFFDDSELIIEKDTVCHVDGDFIFIHEEDDVYTRPVCKGFNIDTIDTVETIK